METTINANARTANIYRVAGVTASGLIAFFLIMRILQLHTIVELRFLNFFIMLFGVRYILLQQRKEDGGKLSYLPGMILGFMTALLTAFFFSIFIFIYLNIDRNFMNFLIATQPFGSYLTPAATAVVTLLEGSASGSIVAFMLMHTLNRDADAG